MVSIKLQGGLCNQMFMIAFLVSYAKKHNLEYVLPREVVNPHIPGSRYVPDALQDKFIPYCIHTYIPPHITNERHFEYFDYPKLDNTTFVGYFQSHKYFDEKMMQEIFNLEWKNITDVCAIHIRRGDYLKWWEYHPAVDREYISTAMDFMNAFFGINKFIFFSDGINWCIENFFDKTPYKVSYMTGGDEIHDLTAISHHQFMIGSNSAYSLWGHYLNRNENKFAIFPDNWFGPKLQHDTKDLYPPKSIMM